MSNGTDSVEYQIKISKRMIKEKNECIDGILLILEITTDGHKRQ